MAKYQNLEDLEKKANKLIQSLIRAKELPLSKWLFAMGIHNFGESAANECSRLHNDFFGNYKFKAYR